MEELYPEFRSAVEIKEIDDRAAKEIFIAMEECFIHGESGIDSLLSRIKYENLRNYFAKKGTSEEFKGNSAGSKRRFMEDGINSVKKKRLEKRLIEINAEMREIERTAEGSANIDELLAEKKQLDSQIRKLEGR